MMTLSSTMTLPYLSVADILKNIKIKIIETKYGSNNEYEKICGLGHTDE